MYGNVVTNRQLRGLNDTKCVEIQNFSSDNLKAAAYTLNPGRILRRSEDGVWEVCHTFSKNRSQFILRPNEYVQIEPIQHVSINVDGIVGNFIVASSAIDDGLMIIAGQIDSKYGAGSERLKFGVKNLLDIENTIRLGQRIVHLQFIDLRGSASDPVKLSEEQKKIWKSRADWAENNAYRPDLANE